MQGWTLASQKAKTHVSLQDTKRGKQKGGKGLNLDWEILRVFHQRFSIFFRQEVGKSVWCDVWKTCNLAGKGSAEAKSKRPNSAKLATHVKIQQSLHLPVKHFGGLFWGKATPQCQYPQQRELLFQEFHNVFCSICATIVRLNVVQAYLSRHAGFSDLTLLYQGHRSRHTSGRAQWGTATLAFSTIRKPWPYRVRVIVQFHPFTVEWQCFCMFLPSMCGVPCFLRVGRSLVKRGWGRKLENGSAAVLDHPRRLKALVNSWERLLGRDVKNYSTFMIVYVRMFQV